MMGDSAAERGFRNNSADAETGSGVKSLVPLVFDFSGIGEVKRKKQKAESRKEQAKRPLICCIVASLNRYIVGLADGVDGGGLG